MADIRNAGITKQQLLAVWATNPDTGFTPAQLILAGISIAEMQSNNITLSQIHAGGVIISYLLGTGMTIAQLRNGGIPDYILINEACNTPTSNGTDLGHIIRGPLVKLLSTNLSATNTQVVLEGDTEGSLRWQISSITGIITFDDESTINGTATLGSARAVYLGERDGRIVSTISLPFDYVFSNLTVTVADGQLRSTSIQLCPGR